MLTAPHGLADAAAIFSVLSSEKRLEILHLVRNREVCVGDIAAKIKLSQSAVFQHLSKMRSTGVVNVRRESQVAYYCASGDIIEAIFQFIEVLGSETLRFKKV